MSAPALLYGPPRTLRMPGVPESVRTARALARTVLGPGHPAAEAAAVCVSELVTNAITYTRSGRPGGQVTVTITPAAGAAVVAVTDDGGALTQPCRQLRPARLARAGETPVQLPEHGYGLRIVAALSAEWGTCPAAAGTCTWCWIGPPADPGQPPQLATTPGTQVPPPGLPRRDGGGITEV